MIEKYKDRLKEILSDEKVVKRRSTKRRSTKRRSTKRRSTKRRLPKRRSPKRRSRFGDAKRNIINNIANAKGANAEENDDEVEVPPTRARDSLSKQRILNAEERVKNAEAEAALANEALAKANEALAEAEVLANEAPPPLPPLPPIRPVSKWGTPGDRGPAPPPTERKRADPGLQIPDNEKSVARAAASAEGFQKSVLKLVDNIKDLGGKTTFRELFEKYENVSDSLNGFLRSAKRQNLIKYEGEMLLYPKDKDVVITVI